ncbi:MAG: hypothetical protein JNK89_05405 [Saprospiraceae bacterium]|nr:hypothetical protein [Saprospiraceae bacterium]
MTMFKKQTGIWLDFKEAYLITLADEKAEPAVQHIRSDIEWGVPKGGSRSKQPWGPHMAVSEQAFLARRKQEEKRYMEAIIAAIDPEADGLMIFGPAEAKIRLQQAIHAARNFGPRLLAVETADSMTPNQMVAAVRAFFAEKVG